MGELLLLLSLVSAWLTFNAYRPMYASSPRAAISFFAGWLTAELALHQIAWQLLAAIVLVLAGALATWSGRLALPLLAASWAGLALCFWRAREAEGAIEGALARTLGPAYREEILPELSEQLPDAIDWKEILLPFPMRHPEVERVRNIVYTRAGGIELKLDVYRRRDRPTGCPTLMQIHGGAWILGSKNEQGIPLMLRLASAGWVAFSVDYRLSPSATFPEHLLDLKRALAWIRERGREYGADPDFLVVTGGSAGGHLASLVALTANDPEYQPGFEQVDTAVQGCVSFYGVYDFADRHKVMRNTGLAQLLERRVMKKRLDEATEAYEKASPISRITRDAPPFLVIHGNLDTLVPVEQARRFVEELHRRAAAPIVYAEIPSAQHAFEIFPSLRAALAIDGVERFLFHLYSRYRQAAAGRREPESAEVLSNVS